MNVRRRCETVLLVNEDREFIDVAGDALRAQGLAVLLVPGFDRALAAMRSGFSPDAILVDLTTGAARFGKFLQVLFEEPAWRAVPVLGVSEATNAIFQISPRHQCRKLPFPSDASRMSELLEFVCADVQRPGLHAQG